MKVRVAYTIDLTDEARLTIAAHFGRWPSRSDVASYLMDEGVGGLEEISGEHEHRSADDMKAWGTPADVIRRHFQEST